MGWTLPLSKIRDQQVLKSCPKFVINKEKSPRLALTLGLAKSIPSLGQVSYMVFLPNNKASPRRALIALNQKYVEFSFKCLVSKIPRTCLL